MNPFTKLLLTSQAWLKAFTMHWTGRTTQWWGSYTVLPRTTANYAREVGDGRSSSLVMSILMWAARTFPESPIVVTQQERDGTTTMVTDHPLLDLLRKPNPYYSGLLMTMALIVDYLALGNAYLLKVRSGAGKPVELWYAPTTTLEPKWPDDGSAYISHYEYRPNGGIDPIRVDTEDVVHFRYGLDPANTRKGLSLLATVLREVYTDDEAAAFTAALLHNLGIPGVVITPAKDEHVDEDGAKAIKESFAARFGGDRRGEPLVLSGPSTVTVLGFSPEQLDLKALRRVPEERISAIFGVPAIVVGLGAGLDRSTYANMAEAREAAYESFIIPLQRLLAAELSSQLLPDFDTRPGIGVGFDLTQVRVLQADENALTTRIAAQVAAGLITIGQGRTALGYDAGPEHEVYVLPSSMTLVSAAELEAAATAEPSEEAPVIVPPAVTELPPEAPAQLPPPKRLRAVKAKPAVVPITDEDLQDAADDWDALVDPEFVGLLEAAVIE